MAANNVLNNPEHVNIYGNVTVVGGNYIVTNTYPSRDILPSEDIECILDHVRFPYSELQTCAKGTRETVLGTIQTWIDIPSVKITNGQSTSLPAANRYSRDNATVFWMQGLAGSGKSTIAGTVAQACSELGIVAEFFCSSQGHPYRGDAKLIIPMVALQLSKRYGPAFENGLPSDFKLKTSREYPMHIQLEALILRPLKRLGEKEDVGPSVVVIDALDECQEKQYACQFVEVLAKRVKHMFPIRFIITSRPEIQKGVQSTSGIFEGNLSSLSSPKDLQQDIGKYLRQSLQNAKQDQLEALTKAAHGLFIYAATCVRYIKDIHRPSDVENLKQLLSMIQTRRDTSHTGVDGLPEALVDLYTLYTNILDSLKGHLKLEALRTTLGTIPSLRQPLSHEDIDALLDAPPNNTLDILSSFPSIVDTGYRGDGEYDVVKLLHPSFGDFLLYNGPKASDYYINPTEIHGKLVDRCFCIWTEDFDSQINKWKEAIKSNASSGVDERYPMKKVMPRHIQYSALWWSEHFCLATRSGGLKLANRLLLLCRSRFVLNWVAICAMLGSLDMAMKSLAYVRRFVETNTEIAVIGLAEQLETTELWIHRFHVTIDEDPSQVDYLMYSPHPLDRTLLDNFALVTELSDGHSLDELGCLRTAVKTHRELKLMTTFVRNEQEWLLLSIGGYMHVWSVSLTSGPFPLEQAGIEQKPWSLAVSIDDRYAAVGYHDSVIKVWDLEALQLVRVWKPKGHQGGVTAIAFSNIPKSSNTPRIVSGDRKGNIILWVLKHGDGEPQAAIVSKSHEPGEIISLSFSDSDSLVLATSRHGRRKSIVTIWDVNLIHSKSLFESTGIIISSAHFLRGQSARRIICSTYDGIVRLWQDENDNAPHLFRELEGSQILALAVFRDGSRFAAKAGRGEGYPGRIHIFSADKSPQALIVMDESARGPLAITHDDRMMVSASENTVKLWRIPPLLTRQHIPESIRCMTFSGNGKYLLTASANQIKLWGADNGFKRPLDLNSPIEVEQQVRSAVFDHGGLQIVIGGRDGDQKNGSVYLVDISSLPGVTITILVASAGNPVEVLAFSPSQRYLAFAFTEDLYPGVAILDLAEPHQSVTKKFLRGHKRQYSLTSIAWSSDETRIVSCSEDTSVSLWDVSDGSTSRLWTVLLPRACAIAASFTLDSAYKGIITASQNGQVIILDKESGRFMNQVPKPPATETMHYEAFKDLYATLNTLYKSNLVGSCVLPQDCTTHNTSQIVSHLAWLTDPMASEYRPVAKLITRGSWMWCLRREKQIIANPKFLNLRLDGKIAQWRNFVAFATGTGLVYVLDIDKLLRTMD